MDEVCDPMGAIVNPVFETSPSGKDWLKLVWSDWFGNLSDELSDIYFLLQVQLYLITNSRLTLKPVRPKVAVNVTGYIR